MLDDMGDAQLLPYRHGPVAAIVIDQDHFVHYIERDLRIGLAKGQLCIVSRNQDRY